MMEYIMENWPMLIAAAAVVVMVGNISYGFYKKPRSEQIEQLRKWLLYAVIRAEKQLGTGTGKLKLVMVYDCFVERFPWLAKIVSFGYFSELVDDALAEMRKMLSENENIRAIVEGSTGE